MNERTTKRPSNDFERYHAHLYYDASTIAIARRIRFAATVSFNIEPGRIHEKQVGPHPRWSCQLAFDKDEFERFIPWLESVREGLTVFVHPVHGDVLAEHTTDAAWLGDPVALNIGFFDKFLK